MNRIFFVILLLNITFICAAQESPQYEFRAVWVATVDNIDFPSKKGLPSYQQKQEFTDLLDMHKRNGMNAVVVQIRPVSDAFYPSNLEPWSEFLTGKQGLAPNPYYDPLQFMIEETHKRGMEFHAWLNPYRAVFNINKSSISSTHITKIFPKMAVAFGSYKWYDPGLPQVREYVNRIVKDLVERYELDGIHFDDYFYPYPINGKPFPDEATYARYGDGMDKGDWRRSNVDTIIKQLSNTIKKANPRVKFGISPFGVWRNQSKDARGSESKAGITNYDDLYADILLWLQNGWIDYVAPQLYWETSHSYVGFNMLLDWWSKHTFGKQLFIGQAIYRSLESRTGSWKTTTEIPKQIRAIRANDEALGSIYFSSKTFESNPMGWNDSLRNNYYKRPALIPPMMWIDSIPPLKPMIENLSKDEVRIFYRGAEPIKQFAVYTIDDSLEEIIENATLTNVFVADKTFDLKISAIKSLLGEKIFVAAVDKNNVVSDWVQVKPLINTADAAVVPASSASNNLPSKK